MTHEEFAKFILDLMSGIPGIGARPFYAELIQNKGFEIWLRWEWIKDTSPLSKIDGEHMDMRDGEEWVCIFVYPESQVPAKSN